MIATPNGAPAEMTLAHRERLPLPVMLIWLCAFAGLVLYTASCYVPALAQLGK